MVLSELSGTLIFPDIRRNNISTIKTKLESKLNALKERTNVIDNVISFKMIEINIASGIGKSPYGYLIFRIYKEGRIVLEKEENILKIHWTVKLDTLYFIAIYCSIVAGITASFYADTNLLSSLCIGIGIFIMFISLGILLIKYKLSDLICDSVLLNH